MDDLVWQALQEGRLTVAGGGPAALYTPWAAGFEKQYPGMTVQVRGAFSNQLVADIDRQLQGGAPAVDVAILQTPQDFARWKAAGALLKTDIPAADTAGHRLDARTLARRHGGPGRRGICPGRRRCLSQHPGPRSPHRTGEGAADRGAFFMPPYGLG